MFVVDHEDDSVYQWSLSTAFDLSSTVTFRGTLNMLSDYQSHSADTSSETERAQDLEFNNDELIVYTCLIGNNEGLNSQPCFHSSKLRHVCLTDDPNLISDDWEIFLVDRIIPNDCYRSQRYFKINLVIYWEIRFSSIPKS